jgi:7,8-dihydropterin-6-yl-methyl-4-(beta-D-ribofuranosyl)aminobenzene 5'-phosphate synthase
MAAALIFVLLMAGAALPAPAAEAGVQIQIVYDNTAASPGFAEDWGFAAVVTAGDRRVLFDSGADAELFLRNLARLDIDPASISHSIISHHHSDHIKGIYRLALRNPEIRVYFLDSFPESAFEVARAVGLAPVRVTGPLEIAPGFHTTGPIEGPIPEQALVVETASGPVVLTGCSHPGIVKIVEAVREQRGAGKIRLLAGGFHLMRQSEEEITPQLERLVELRVEQIAPMHCSGELAKTLCRRIWNSRYVAGGAGRSITIE